MESSSDAVPLTIERKRHPRVSHEEFVRVYTQSETSEEVAAKLGISRPSVHMKANYLRKLGVVLKQLSRTRKKREVDVAMLNGITKVEAAE